MAADFGSMRAVVVDRPGGPDVLSIGWAERPAPAAEELLVRVRAAALNRADLMQRAGRYPPPEGASPILGLDMAGIVEQSCKGCDEWAPGDRVCGLLPGGGYAEFAAIHRDLAIRLPPSMSFEEGAAIPEVFLTAFQALFWLGGLESGMRVLIHAGASGVGTAAIQLAKSAGATAYVTASAGKHDACLRLGADLAVDYKTEDFAERILAETEGMGVDLILDFVGAPYFTKNLKALAVDGRIILLATLGGSKVEEVDLRDLFGKRGHVIATSLRNRDPAYKIRLTQDFRAEAMPLFERGVLRPVIDRVFDWSDVAEAHRYMEENRNVGKIILQVGEIAE